MWKTKIRENSEVLTLFLLLLISALLHFVNLDEPKAVIFDEVYYARYLNSYGYTGEYLFDVHPPHSKILISVVAKAMGYSGGFDFKQIGQTLGELNVFAMRFLPALFGTFLPLLFYFFIRLLGGSIAVSMLSALALTFDGGFLIQTRTIAQDGMLVFWILASCSVLLAAREKASAWSAPLAGALAGMAIGSKFTGLVSPFLCTVILFIYRRNLREFLTRFSYFVAVMGAVYLLGWWFHFQLMNGPGQGDAFYQRTGAFFTDTWNLHRVMFEANARIADFHRYASRWYGWPFMNKPIYYWVEGERVIYFIGNPVVWYGAFVLLVLAVFSFLKKPKKWMLITGFPLLGYFVSYVPYFPVSRPLFLYHYMTPLVFSITSGLLWWEKTAWGISVLGSRVKMGLVVAALLVGYLLISPLIYGFDLPGQIHLTLFEFIPNWR